MHPLSGPLLVAMIVLALGGLLKVARPDDTAGALHALGWPSGTFLVRMLGTIECAIGLGAITVSHRLLPALAGAIYLAFAAFVMVALGRGTAIQSCGCFGRVDTPPSVAHIFVNLSAAATAIAYGLTSSTTLLASAPDHWAEAVPLLALSSVGVYLVYVTLTALPQALGEVRKRTA